MSKIEQTEEKPKRYRLERIIQQYLKFDHEWLNYKHKNCKHPNGCLTQITDMTLRGQFIGMIIKASITVLKTLLKQKMKAIKNPFLLLQALANKDILQFGVMPAVYNLVLQASHCGLRHAFESNSDRQESINSFVAGFMAGFISLLTKSDKYTQMLFGVFLISRAFECCLNCVQERGYIPKSPLYWYILFCCTWAGMGPNFMFELGNIAPSLRKFYNDFSYKDQSELDYFTALMYKTNKELYLKYRAKPQVPTDYFSKPSELIDVFGMYSKKK